MIALSENSLLSENSDSDDNMQFDSFDDEVSLW